MLKKKKKKNIYIYIYTHIYNKAKPTASPLQVARSRQAHGFSTKKKKKNTENQKLNPSRRWQNPITLRRRWQRDQTPIQKQTKHRGAPANQTQSTEVFIKKKIPNTQTKTNPVTHEWSRGRRHRCRRSSLVVVIVARPVTPHRRS